MHGAAGDRHPRRERLLHRVPPGEGGEQGGVGVEDPAGEGVEQRPGEHGAEAGHGHEVDVVRRAAPSVTAPGECPSGRTPRRSRRSPCGRRARRRRPPPAATSRAATGSVGQHHRDRERPREHGVEDAPRTRHEHRHAHAGHATSGAARASRRAQSSDLTISTMRSPASVGLSATVAPGLRERRHLGLGGALGARDDGAGVAHLAARRGGDAGDVTDDGLGHVVLDEPRRLFFGRPADLPDHHDGAGVGVLLEGGQAVDEARARHGVAADARRRWSGPPSAGTARAAPGR